jgi:hypothetical protein
VDEPPRRPAVLDAIPHSPAAVAFPLLRISTLVWEASDVFVDYCNRKVHADDYEEYLDLEALSDAFTVVFEALDQFDHRFAKR